MVVSKSSAIWTGMTFFDPSFYTFVMKQMSTVEFLYFFGHKFFITYRTIWWMRSTKVETI